MEMCYICNLTPHPLNKSQLPSNQIMEMCSLLMWSYKTSDNGLNEVDLIFVD